MGASAKTMRQEVSCIMKHFPFTRTGLKFFSKNTIVWEHTHTFLIYIPISEFTKFDK